tara:strand:+ start:176 stop:553 length:378 start_codon:yes stop_codon:yes gene_type:complete
MGLERTSTIGGDGVGVSGIANLETTLTEAGGNPVFTNPLLVKNMPSLRVLFSPLANLGSTAVIQIAQRGANAAGSLNWLTVQTVVLGGLTPVLIEFKFPTDFMRVGITPNAAVLTQVTTTLGCSI